MQITAEQYRRARTYYTLEAAADFLDISQNDLRKLFADHEIKTARFEFNGEHYQEVSGLLLDGIK